VRNFKKQLAYLAEKCQVVKPSDIKECKPQGRKPIVGITFDDGFVCIVETALPLLKKHHLPAGVCVPTGSLGQGLKLSETETPAYESEVVINERQILNIDSASFEIFSHSVSHVRLNELEDHRLEAELAGSKQVLETILGHKILGISYPYGCYDARVCRAAKQAGYMIGFTTEPRMVGKATDVMQIGRFSISAKERLAVFKLKVNGGYQVSRYLRMVKRLVLRK
jgi:peptidoglycan/xylan/chitin deacetylase (PgdA/CDA1 family)